jgi:hypothetical protein
MRKACIFCGRDDIKITKEHVFPDWLSKMFPDNVFAINEGINADGKVAYRYRSKMFQHTMNCVCIDCNNTWMSNIENEAKHILIKMLNAKNFVLDKKSQRRIANWGMKTILVLNHNNPAPPESPYIPREHYQTFFEAKGVSAGNVMLLGSFEKRAYQGGDRIASNLIDVVTNLRVPKEVAPHVEARIAGGGRIYYATLNLGNIVFQLVGNNVFDGTDHKLELIVQPEPMRILNPFHTKIRWPLRYSVDAIGGLDAAHLALSGS